MNIVAALFVESRGCYGGLEDCEIWDKARDARTYAGPHPVVAHPPCARWCQLAGLVEHRYGHRKGDDGGAFAAALTAVRRFGGVLEHPAFSAAFTAYELPVPVSGGWQRGIDGGWVTHVDQWNYGHRAKKATWLYAYGVDARDLPALRWKRVRKRAAVMSWSSNRQTAGMAARPRVAKRAASATPIEFRDLLLGIARCAHGSATI